MSLADTINAIEAQVREHDVEIKKWTKRRKILAALAGFIAFIGVGTIVGGIVFVARQPTPAQLEKMQDRIEQTRDIVHDVQIKQATQTQAITGIQTTLDRLEGLVSKGSKETP